MQNRLIEKAEDLLVWSFCVMHDIKGNAARNRMVKLNSIAFMEKSSSDCIQQRVHYYCHQRRVFQWNVFFHTRLSKFVP